MRSSPSVAALLILLCVVVSSMAEAPRKPVDNELIGSWLLLQINRGGKDIDLDHLEGAIRKVESDTYIITPLEGPAITGTYTVNPTATPRTIDMHVQNGRFKGGILKGIYQVKKKRLTISFASPGGERPTALESREGTAYTVAIHKLVKPKVKKKAK